MSWGRFNFVHHRLDFLPMILLFCLASQSSLADPSYFPETYHEAKSKFRSQALARAKLNGEVRFKPYPVQGVVPHETIDTLYLPARNGNTEKLIVLTSGMHGVEGFAGSAVQMLLLKEFIPQFERNLTSVLFIHGINAWGYHQCRRVSRNNVDLNRNFAVDSKLYRTRSPEYGKANPSLNRQVPSAHFLPWRSGFSFSEFFSVIRLLGLASSSAVRHALVAGQYDYPKGVFYGGTAMEPEAQTVKKILADHLAPYRSVLIADLHTGYGYQGLNFFGMSRQQTRLIRPKKRELAHYDRDMRVLYAGFSILAGERSDSYVTHGDFLLYVPQLFPNKKVYAMTMEYGTLGASQWSQADTLLRVRAENQGYHWGYRTDRHKRRVLKNFRELFYPSDLSWRNLVVSDTRNKLITVLKRFSKLE